MSPRWNWDSPTPSLAREYAPTPGTKGGGHTRLRVRGGGVPIPTTGEKAQHSAYSVLQTVKFSRGTDFFLAAEFLAGLAGFGNTWQFNMNRKYILVIPNSWVLNKFQYLLHNTQKDTFIADKFLLRIAYSAQFTVHIFLSVSIFVDNFELQGRYVGSRGPGERGLHQGIHRQYLSHHY